MPRRQSKPSSRLKRLRLKESLRRKPKGKPGSLNGRRLNSGELKLKGGG
jgi:hypothetical protein